MLWESLRVSDRLASRATAGTGGLVRVGHVGGGRLVTAAFGAGLVDGRPHPVRRARHQDVLDTEVPDGIEDSVDDGWGRGDRASLSHPFHPERVGRRRGRGPVRGERRQVRRAQIGRASCSACVLIFFVSYLYLICL